MSIPRITQDCYHGRESYTAKLRCDGCGTHITVAGEGHPTERRVRTIASDEHWWGSCVNPNDRRKKPGRLDYCPSCP